MGVEKETSKGGGGYVGGFLQLFDWKAKSRKKLFSNKSDLPERSKKGKKSDGNFPMTRLNLIDDDEIGAGPSIRSSEYNSCASSVTDEEGFGARAPGVVARLMGLDCMPTSNSAEPYSTPFFDTQSLRDDHYRRRNFDYNNENPIMHARNPLESKPPKMPSRPIEKFQTEILPPKSAKSIPITHHKLLSPIKSPGFISAKNAAHIMEAAAKIIEPEPPGTTKGKMPLVGSSSAPLKVRDLKEKAEATRKVCPVGFSSGPLKVKDMKEKVEAAHKPSRLVEAPQRPIESNAAKFLKGQSPNKSWNGSLDTMSFRASPELEEGSSGVKNNMRSVSLAIQAKVNVQRREGMNPCSNRTLVRDKEKNDIKSSEPFKSQRNVQKNLHKKNSTNNAVGVLRQNNQKQNCQIAKEKLPSKSSGFDSRGRKLQPEDPSFGQQKSSSKIAGNSKVASRKLGVEVTDSEKEVPYSRTKNFQRKKRPLDADFNFEKDRMVDYAGTDKDRKSVQPIPVVDKHFSWAEDSRKKGMDVISFTFTAPLARSMHNFETSSEVSQETHRGKRVLVDSDGMKLSALGYNGITGDALSLLLEQKLRDLTYAMESSSHDASPSNLHDLAPTLNAVCTNPRMDDKRDQPQLHRDGMGSKSSSAFSTTYTPIFRFKHKFQGVNEMDECSVNDNECRQLLDCRHPSPVSILEPSFSNESCNSSDTTNSNSMEGSNWCSSVQAQEVVDWSFRKKLHIVEADVELSDSATSTSTGTAAATTHATPSTVTYQAKPVNWELEYVKDIMCNVEVMFEDYAFGRAHELVNPQLFDQLESRIGELDSDVVELKIRRKVLFDCVSECLDLRCSRYVGGGWKTWTKGVATVRRKERLAEEVYQEITRWNGMGDCMVDELVDRDMSSQYGKWLDFEVDAFGFGAEIEAQIFSSLVDEVVADILQF